MSRRVKSGKQRVHMFLSSTSKVNIKGEKAQLSNQQSEEHLNMFKEYSKRTEDKA